MAHHHVKTWPEFFEKTWAKIKPWELRLNDRDYRVGDTVTQHEWSQHRQAFTGRWISGEITFLALELVPFGLADGFCAFTFQELDRDETGGGFEPAPIPVVRK